MNTVSPKHGLSILPGKGTFHSGPVPAPESQAVLHQPESTGRAGRGRPTHWDAGTGRGLRGV